MAAVHHLLFFLVGEIEADSWYAVAQRLANQYQVFLLDLPGFGGSDAPDTIWGVEEYSNIVKRFIKEMEIEKPILLGHSHGGKVACFLAQEI